MFEALSTSALQHYWWILISVLGAAFVFLTFVQGGQTLISQLPTCSQYALDAIERYGVVRGTIKAGLRILRCNPFFPGGSDPA